MENNMIRYIQEQIAEFAKSGGQTRESIDILKDLREKFQNLPMETIPPAHRAKVMRVRNVLLADKTSSMGEPKFTEMKVLFGTIEASLHEIIGAHDREPSSNNRIGFKI